MISPVSIHDLSIDDILNGVIHMSTCTSTNYRCCLITYYVRDRRPQMEKPDRDEIPRRNPRINLEDFEENERKLAVLRPNLQKNRRRGGTITPFGGKRLISDNQPESVDLNRVGFGFRQVSK